MGVKLCTISLSPLRLLVSPKLVGSLTIAFAPGKLLRDIHISNRTNVALAFFLSAISTTALFCCCLYYVRGRLNRRA